MADTSLDPVTTAPAVEAASATETASAETATPVVKRRLKRAVTRGIVHIYTHPNNTLVSVTDDKGNALSWSSAGSCGFKGSRKATPYAGTVAVEKAMEKAEIYGLTEVDVRVQGIGAARDQAVRAVISRPNINVLSIIDRTPIPHGGCRRKKVRRV